MQSSELQRLRRQRPFVPFALHMLDGARYEIYDPGQLLVTERFAYVGVTSGGWDGIADDVTICSLVQVTRAVPLGRSQGS
jgi:hypothetical protein